MEDKAIDIGAVWLLLMGVYPFADPGHSADTILSALDLGIHLGAALLLLRRWKLVRREKA